MVVTEKENTWVTICKESAKRETEIFKMMRSLTEGGRFQQRQDQENLEATP